MKSMKPVMLKQFEGISNTRSIALDCIFRLPFMHASEERRKRLKMMRDQSLETVKSLPGNLWLVMASCKIFSNLKRFYSLALLFLASVSAICR